MLSKGITKLYTFKLMHWGNEFGNKISLFFPLSGIGSEAQNEGEHFYPWEEICFSDFGRVQNFSAVDLKLPRFTQGLLVLTGS